MEQKLTGINVNICRPSSIIALTKAVCTSETSVKFNVTTRRYIPEDSKFHIRRLKNLKSHIVVTYFAWSQSEMSYILALCMRNRHMPHERFTAVTNVLSRPISTTPKTTKKSIYFGLIKFPQYSVYTLKHLTLNINEIFPFSEHTSENIGHAFR
jgi:hypothetical protein